jgi:hypothetical protein
MGTRSLLVVDRTDTPQPCGGEWSVPKTYPQRSPTRTSRASPRHMTLVRAVLGGPRPATRLPIPSLLGRCSEALGSSKNPRFTGIFLSLEPSDGLEPSTPSLPFDGSGNARQPTATGLACFARFPAGRFAADCQWLALLGSMNAPYPLNAAVLFVANSPPEVADLDEVTSVARAHSKVSTSSESAV